VQTLKAQLPDDPHTAKEVQNYFSYLFNPVVKLQIAMTDSIRRLQLKTHILTGESHYQDGQQSKGSSKTSYDRQGRITKTVDKSDYRAKRITRTVYL
jgi:hypothetical protein